MFVPTVSLPLVPKETIWLPMVSGAVPAIIVDTPIRISEGLMTVATCPATVIMESVG